MVIPRFFVPIGFGIESVYTIVILIFCLLLYFKTREIYNLTKYKGIQFFRYAFLFFGLAYASRLFLYLIIFGDDFMFDFFMHRRAILPVSSLVVAYFSTMAILYLIYSTVWRKFSSEHFFTFSNIIALFVAVIAFISRSPIIVSMVQLLLLIIAIIIIFKTYKKGKKRSHIRTLYLLILSFWLVDLFVLGPRRFLPFEAKVVSQIILIFVFVAIYYKVIKWIK